MPSRPAIIRAARDIKPPELGMLPGITPVLGGRLRKWLVTANPTLDADNSGWNGVTLRQLVTAGGLANVNGSQIRVTLVASSVAACVIANAYVGNGALTGNAYNFAATPVQLLFGGASGVTIAAGSQIVSDPATFTIGTGNNLLVSAYFNGTSSVRGIASVTANWSAYYKTANDAATVSTSGYTMSAGGTARNYLLGLVESYV